MFQNVPPKNYIKCTKCNYIFTFLSRSIIVFDVFLSSFAKYVRKGRGMGGKKPLAPLLKNSHPFSFSIR